MYISLAFPENRYPYFACRGSSADTRVPPRTNQRALGSYSRIIDIHTRSWGHWQGQLFGMLGKGTKTENSSKGPAFFAGCTPYPQDSSGTPPARGPAPQSVGRGAGSPSPRLAPPSATGHRPGAHVPGRSAWRRRAARGLARPLLRVRALYKGRGSEWPGV